jgi:hypothetical protein
VLLSACYRLRWYDNPLYLYESLPIIHERNHNLPSLPPTSTTVMDRSPYLDHVRSLYPSSIDDSALSRFPLPFQQRSESTTSVSSSLPPSENADLTRHTAHRNDKLDDDWFAVEHCSNDELASTVSSMSNSPGDQENAPCLTEEMIP